MRNFRSGPIVRANLGVQQVSQVTPAHSYGLGGPLRRHKLLPVQHILFLLETLATQGHAGTGILSTSPP